eukprot:scaffold103409_cov45-Phaeocystis_antarctica.AAC.2
MRPYWCSPSASHSACLGAGLGSGAGVGLGPGQGLGLGLGPGLGLAQVGELLGGHRPERREDVGGLVCLLHAARGHEDLWYLVAPEDGAAALAHTRVRARLAHDRLQDGQRPLLAAHLVRVRVRVRVRVGSSALKHGRSRVGVGGPAAHLDECRELDAWLVVVLGAGERRHARALAGRVVDGHRRAALELRQQVAVPGLRRLGARLLEGVERAEPVTGAAAVPVLVHREHGRARAARHLRSRLREPSLPEALGGQVGAADDDDVEALRPLHRIDLRQHRLLLGRQLGGAGVFLIL